MSCNFASPFVVLSSMKTYANYPFRVFFCCVTMMTLLWLAIGTSFVFNQLPKFFIPQSASNEESNKDHDAGTPFEKSTEEKVEFSSNDFTLEYLCEDIEQFSYSHNGIKYNKYHPAQVFVNFCCDSVSPPPEISVC